MVMDYAYLLVGGERRSV